LQLGMLLLIIKYFLQVIQVLTMDELLQLHLVKLDLCPFVKHVSRDNLVFDAACDTVLFLNHSIKIYAF